jgi:peptide deformylase
MAIKKILTEPDPFLRQKSHVVDKVDNETRKLMDDMLDTMYAAPGIGLAAIQIGVPKRIIVIDLSKEEVKKPLYFVNPKIILKSDNKSTYEEGCLSVPGQFAEIDRPDQCHLTYFRL